MEEERRHASPEGLRSEKDAVSIVKHNEHEKSTTTTMNKLREINYLYFRCSFSLCFHSQHVRDLTLYHVFLVPLFLILMPLWGETPLRHTSADPADPDEMVPEPAL